MEDVLAGGMVDSFAEFYPKAQGRFTCAGLSRTYTE